MDPKTSLAILERKRVAVDPETALRVLNRKMVPPGRLDGRTACAILVRECPCGDDREEQAAASVAEGAAQAAGAVRGVRLAGPQRPLAGLREPLLPADQR